MAHRLFSFIAFMPALLKMKGRMASYRGHKIYVDISCHENSPADQPGFFGARNMTANAIITIDGRGYFDLIDDWLTRNQFVFIGWSGLLLTTTYLAIGD